MLTLEQVKDVLKSNKGKWIKGTHQGNDGNQGNTLEALLGVAENNLQLPDLGQIELKSQKNETGSFITLFHKEPLPSASVPKIIKSLGWKHQKAGTKYGADEMRFSSTTYGHKYTNRGFRIELTEDRINFVYDPNFVKREGKDLSRIYNNLGEWMDDVSKRDLHYSKVMPAYWIRKEFEKICISKLNNTLMCYCDTKQIEGEHYYKFTDAVIYSNFKSENLEKLFLKGAIVMDFDARTNHNHGVKLRVKKANLSDLFEFTEKVF